MSGEDLPFPNKEIAQSASYSLFDGDITKAAIKSKAEQDTNAVLNKGYINPLSAYIRLKGISEYAAEAMKLLHDAAHNEAAKYSKGENKLHGVVFEQAVTGTRYSYDHDEEWKALQGAIKEREELMRKADGATVIDETGEVIPPAKKNEGKPGLKITIPK